MKLKKKMISVLICIGILILLPTMCYGRQTTGTDGGSSGRKEISIGGIDISDYKPDDLTEGDINSAFDLGRTIITGLTTVGIILSVMMMIVLGIKYMTGSVEEKAEYKKTMLPMFIGCIFIFLSATIVAVIYGIVANIN